MADNDDYDAGDDGSDSGLSGAFHHKSRRKSPLKFEQMSADQKFIASLFMLFVSNADTQDEEQNKEIADALNFDDVKSYKTWRADMAKRAGEDADGAPDSSPEIAAPVSDAPSAASGGWDWKVNTDFNHIAPGKTRGPADFTKMQRYVETAPAVKIGTGAHQTGVLSVLEDAAQAADVSSRCLGGIWGVESGFGKGLCSSTGCQGDFQFTHGTFNSMMTKYGSEIAQRLRAGGHEAEAKEVEQYKAGDFMKLSNDPLVSTYAAAFYMKDVAHDIGIKPGEAAKQENWGKIYAGYNIGPGNAKKLTGQLADTGNVGKSLGMVAQVNPMFFTNGATGKEALDKYQAMVERNANSLPTAFTGAVLAQNKPAPGVSATNVTATAAPRPTVNG